MSLAEDLRQLGNDVWFDRELTGGRAWWDHILAKIRECDIYVFALGPESLDSQACGLELRYASQLGKSILPALVAEGVAEELMPPALAAIQYVDYRRNDKKALLSLIKALSAVPRSPPLPDPMPPPPAPPVSYLGILKDEIDAVRALSFAEQSALLLKLKQALSNPKTADLATDLLRRFRGRDDLLAKVAAEIDTALASAGASLRTQKPSDVNVAPIEPPLMQPGAPTHPAPKEAAGAAPFESSQPRVEKASTKPALFAWSVIVLSSLCAGLAISAVVSAAAGRLRDDEFSALWFASSIALLIATVLWRMARARRRQRKAQAP
jgi:hypothetical protein